MKVTINLDEEETKILKKRAKKNLFSIREQVEDIVRRSCIRSKKNNKSKDNIDDKLVKIFSKQNKGRKPSKKKKKNK